MPRTFVPQPFDGEGVGDGDAALREGVPPDVVAGAALREGAAVGAAEGDAAAAGVWGCAAPPLLAGAPPADEPPAAGAAPPVPEVPEPGAPVPDSGAEDGARGGLGAASAGGGVRPA